MTLTPYQGWEVDLAELLRQQLAIYQELRAVGRAQRQSVLKGEADLQELRTLAARRRNLLDRLARIVGRLEVYRSNWLALARTSDSSALANVGRCLHGAAAAMDGLLADERNQACA